MTIRFAEEKDIPRLGELLLQVCQVHHQGRPDLFRSGGRKYDDGELRQLLRDETRPILVAVDERDCTVGYAAGSVRRRIFCVFLFGGVDPFGQRRYGRGEGRLRDE